MADSTYLHVQSTLPYRSSKSSFFPDISSGEKRLEGSGSFPPDGIPVECRCTGMCLGPRSFWTRQRVPHGRLQYDRLTLEYLVPE
jgi:hypothetical protein